MPVAILMSRPTEEQVRAEAARTAAAALESQRQRAVDTNIKSLRAVHNLEYHRERWEQAPEDLKHAMKVLYDVSASYTSELTAEARAQQNIFLSMRGSNDPERNAAMHERATRARAETEQRNARLSRARQDVDDKSTEHRTSSRELLRIRYEALVKKRMDNGWTEEQPEHLACAHALYRSENVPEWMLKASGVSNIYKMLSAVNPVTMSRTTGMGWAYAAGSAGATATSAAIAGAGVLAAGSVGAVVGTLIDREEYRQCLARADAYMSANADSELRFGSNTGPSRSFYEHTPYFSNRLGSAIIPVVAPRGATLDWGTSSRWRGMETALRFPTASEVAARRAAEANARANPQPTPTPAPQRTPDPQPFVGPRMGAFDHHVASLRSRHGGFDGFGYTYRTRF